MTRGVVAVLLLVGCGSATEVPLGSGHGQCQQRAGSYLTKSTRRTGNCGEGTETVTNVTEQPTSPAPPCKGAITYSADNCEVSYESDCPADSVLKGGRATTTGHARWSADGSKGAATEEFVVMDSTGMTVCRGTYDLDIVRQ